MEWIIKQKTEALIEEVTDEILTELIEDHEYVAVYFRGDCANNKEVDCDEVLADLETIDEDLDNIDNIEDIFTLSGSSSGSSTRPDPTESNEFNLDTDQDFDEESLYSDALSRKQSLVRFLVCMS